MRRLRTPAHHGATTRRRICWPEPDASCLRGGCHRCKGQEWHTLSEIQHNALPRGLGIDFQHGVMHDWGWTETEMMIATAIHRKDRR